MSGEVSESAKMTPEGNTDGVGEGMNDGIPPAVDAAQVQEGEPKEYPAGLDPHASHKGHGET